MRSCLELQAPRPSEEGRLPAVAIPVMAMERGLPLLVASIPLLWGSGGGRFFSLLPLAVVLIAPVARFLRFRYRISGDVLTLEGGLLFRWRREIPFARIQSVDVVQKLRHRVFGVVELRIEVVGGRSTEGSFPALVPREAERIRSIVMSETTEAAPEDPKPHLAHLAPPDLLLAGATGGRVAVVALMLGYLQELLPEGMAAGLYERLANSNVTVIVGVVATFLIVSVAISLVATVLVYWDFTVRREGRRVVITRGLLERRRALIPLNRVQALRVQANPIRRLLGLTMVSAVLAGYSPQREERQETGVVLPIGRTQDALRLVERLLDVETGLGALDLEGLSSRALTRRLVYPVLLGAALGGASVVGLGPAGALGFLALPAGSLWAFLAWRAAGHVVAGGHLVVRGGALTRRLYVVPISNVQHLELRISPLQRALALCTVRFKIPKATPALPDLARARGNERFDDLAGQLLSSRPRA